MINDHQMHYIDEGPVDTEAMVMIHGNPSWSFYFRRLISNFSNQYRCIAPDHIGMGLSEKPPASEYQYILEKRIDDLDALLDKLEVKDNITLILHDWGGMIGMGYAVRQPARIKRLIILNTSAFHLPNHMGIPWQLKLGRSYFGPLLIKGFNAFCKGAVKSCVTRAPMDSRTARAYLAPYNSWQNRTAILRFVEDIPLNKGDDSYDAVSLIEANIDQFQKIPMLICWGMKDFVFNFEFLSIWSTHFPEAQIYRFEDAGHYILEDAHREIIPLIQKFLFNK